MLLHLTSERDLLDERIGGCRLRFGSDRQHFVDQVVDGVRFIHPLQFGRRWCGFGVRGTIDGSEMGFACPIRHGIRSVCGLHRFVRDHDF